MESFLTPYGLSNDNRMTTNVDGDDACAGNHMVCTHHSSQQLNWKSWCTCDLGQSTKGVHFRCWYTFKARAQAKRKPVGWINWKDVRTHKGKPGVETFRSPKPDQKPKVTLSNDKYNGKRNKVKNISRQKFSEKNNSKTSPVSQARHASPQLNLSTDEEPYRYPYLYYR